MNKKILKSIIAFFCLFGLILFCYSVGVIIRPFLKIILATIGDTVLGAVVLAAGIAFGFSCYKFGEYL